ncbi:MULTISPECIES: carboxypeptidase regulatory-like domain-containing protein [unclassified Acinetobacter]|uniref:carboxypeptidase regulatory-like domain-containing protein n=1 Tax=unclassified Acinetobacter TaxID=196816 RepID=UPI0015D3C078|nr:MULTISPECIES: carboxypeptidase regulatory-like domain-containing protein [unclassified Acinetobacter]
MNIDHNLKTTIYAANQAQSYTGGKIAGQVKKLGLAYPCFVSVHERVGRKLLEIKQTDRHGNYYFENLNPGFKFIVMAVDHASRFNAVIQDNVVPK